MADGGAITAAFRAGSETFRTRLFVMTGEVRLVGERTPDLPEAAAMAAAGFGPPMVDRLGAVRPKTVFGENDRSPKFVRAASVAGSDQSGPEAGRPSIGEDGRSPRFVRAAPAAGNAVRAGSDRSGPEARRLSVGRDGDRPQCVGVSGKP
ncbi:hypothetical protein [Thalassospira australica]|uniref:hypothetical protein n=1 Tax=Thalassospira australica TaxID=1528106 RepID=UPI00384D1B7E